MLGYRELILYKTYADLRVEAERTYIGFLWWVLDPILSMSIYYVVFGVLFQRGTENYVAFLFIGLVPWRWQTASLSHAGNSLIAGRNLMQQVHLPKVVFPMVSMLTDVVKFCFVFTILLIFLQIYGCPLGWPYLALPAVVLVQSMFIAASCFILAGIVPFAPDLQKFVDYLFRLLFFASGIFWSIDSINNPQYQFYLRLNPVAALIENYRSILLYNRWPSAGTLLTIALLSIAGASIGIWIIGRNDRKYPKLV